MAAIGPKHHAKALAMTLDGSTTREVADALDLSWGAVAKFLRSDEAAPQLEEMRRLRNEEIARIGARKGLDAQGVLVKGLTSNDDRHALACARELLDRWGHPKTDRHEHSGPAGEPVPVPISFNLSTHSDADLDAAKSRLLAARSGVPLRLLQLSIPELRKAIATGRHDKHLEALRKAEEAGRNKRGRSRVGALQVLDARIGGVR